MNVLEMVALGVVGTGIAFVGGCVHGKQSGASERMTLAAEIRTANSSTEVCAASLEALRQQAEADIAKAKRQAEATAKAAESLALENMHLSDALSDSEKALARAGQEPTCRDQLEMELCPAVPLL